MPKIRDILTSADTTNLGLIPYLSDRLGGDWDRFQIRPWNFKTTDPAPTDGRLADNDNNSGFRLGSQQWQRTQDQRTITVTQELRVGYLLTNDDPLELQIAAAELALKINEGVSEWSCCTQWTHKCIDTTLGGFVYSPSPQISSGNPRAWAIAVVREFELVFDTEPSQWVQP
ncbi:MAG: hypothetical protein ACRC62_28065 [Microcoleus sp.]